MLMHSLTNELPGSDGLSDPVTWVNVYYVVCGVSFKTSVVLNSSSMVRGSEFH